MQFIDGRALATKIRQEVKAEITRLGIKPRLAVLLVGDDPASHIYVGLKEKAAHEVGIVTDIRKLPANTQDAELVSIIKEWNASPQISGVLVQLPLPPGHDADAIIHSIEPNKDVDGFHPQTRVIAPVHESILRLIGATGVGLNGQQAIIISNSDIFSEPLSRLLTKAGCRVATFHPDHLDPELIKGGDVVVVAVGRPGFVKRDLIKPGACVIDVGTTRLTDGKISGDVDAESLKDVAGWLSPVPGGVGPLTVALLLKNTLTLSLT